MILSTKENDKVFELFDNVGIKQLAKHSNSAIIKVNIARPPEKGHPRTSAELITRVVRYLSMFNIKCAIAESADGYLEENIKKIGLETLIKEYEVELIDLDFEEVDKIIVDDEEHYIPKVLKNYDIRIAIPATSKRPNRIFSNNIKLFVGAVPRKYYQIGEPVGWRPKIHIDLHKSVENIYKGIMNYAQFDFFINGGLVMDETKGEFELPEVLAGNDGLELDLYILKSYFDIEMPEYIRRLIGDK